MKQRFPDIDWFCDGCGAYLNSQPKFDDRKYVWKCSKCGYKSSLSYANIRYRVPFFVNVLGFVLGWLRALSCCSLIIYLLLHVVEGLSFSPHYTNDFFLSVCIVAYPLFIICSLFFERVIAKYGIHQNLFIWILFTIPIYLLGDLIRPFQEVLGFPFAVHKAIKLRKVLFFLKKLFYFIAYAALIVYSTISLF